MQRRILLGKSLVIIFFRLFPSNILLRGSIYGLLGGSDGKESACNVGDLGLIPGSGKSPGNPG